MSRDAILDKIRAAVAKPDDDLSALRGVVKDRIKAHRRHLVPERGQGDTAALLARFAANLRAQSTTVVELTGVKDIPAAVADYLRQSNLAPRFRMGADPLLVGLEWRAVPALECRRGPAKADDEVGLSRALAGVAETGTLVLGSGAENPVTLGFLPETHIVVVAAQTIVGAYEDAFDIVRKIYGPRTLPRTLNLISGPSRTGDIGGRIVMGAHGPRSMCVMIVSDLEGRR